jgi:SAM-dependent methyltransferase
MNPTWYRTFFSGITVAMWRHAAVAEWTTAEVDLAWRELRLEAGQRVLDCPCGHGRHAVELARRGCRVTGIDLSADALTFAGQAAEDAGVAVDFQQQDMLEIPELPPCDAAVTLGNSFGYVHHEGSARLVKKIAAALRPGGRWLLNTGAVAEAILPNLKPEMTFQVGDIAACFRTKYLAAESCLEISSEMTRGGQTEKQQHWQFVFTAAEILRMLAAAGLTPVALYGGTTREPFALGSHQLYLVAQKSA